jgi:hypothetical protein
MSPCEGGLDKAKVLAAILPSLQAQGRRREIGLARLRPASPN